MTSIRQIKSDIDLKRRERQVQSIVLDRYE